MKELILQIAHKEILQKLRDIAESWQNTLCRLRFSELFSRYSILNFHKSALPTGRKDVALFEGNCQIDQEKQCLDHLKRYVQSLASTDFRRILRVMTGADVI